MKKGLKKSLVYLIMTMLVLPTWLVTGMMNAEHAQAATNVTTVAATSVTSTNATLNGSVGTSDTADTSFWWGPSSVASFTAATDPSVQLPSGWIGVDSFAQSASQSFSYSLTGLSQNTPYYFAAWSLVDGTWYPGGILTFTTHLLGTISAEDFGVVNYNTGLGTLKGYTAGFGLTDATFDVAKSIVVNLYAADNQLLQTNTATLKVGKLTDADAISSPFDVSGTFNYMTDGYWSNQRATEYGQSVPATKVVAIVTLANSKEVKVTNESLTGDNPTTIMLPGTLSAEDFGVVNYAVGGGLGTLSGYTAGFGLTAADFTDASSVVMQLFADGGQLLQTNTLNGPNAGLITGIQVSSPFDVSGTFNYTTDGYWTNVRETEYGQSVSAIKVVATVTLVNGKVVIAENTSLTGDPTTIYVPAITVPAITVPASPVITSKVIEGRTIELNWSSVEGAKFYYVYVSSSAISEGQYIRKDKIVAPVTHDEITVGAYGKYYVVVTAEDVYGNVSAIPIASNQTIVNVTAPATVTKVAPAPAPVTTSIAPQAAQAAEPTTTTPAVTNSNTNADDQGQIKGDETTNNETEKTNWTPWIVLFVLIILAGAATGGYFYWFAGEDEVQAVVKEPKKEEKSEKFETSVKTKQTNNKPNKKAKRW